MTNTTNTTNTPSGEPSKEWLEVERIAGNDGAN